MQGEPVKSPVKAVARHQDGKQANPQKRKPPAEETGESQIKDLGRHQERERGRHQERERGRHQERERERHQERERGRHQEREREGLRRSGSTDTLLPPGSAPGGRQTG